VLQAARRGATGDAYERTDKSSDGTRVHAAQIPVESRQGRIT
jgi:hypothetical protein